MQKLVLIKFINRKSSTLLMDDFNIREIDGLDNYLSKGFTIENAFPLKDDLLVVLTDEKVKQKEYF
jgi:hypothetical protein